MFIFIILAVAVFIWMAVTFRARKAVRNCRWRENRRLDRDGQRYFHCTYCGAEAWSADLKPPKACLKPAADA